MSIHEATKAVRTDGDIFDAQKLVSDITKLMRVPKLLTSTVRGRYYHWVNELLNLKVSKYVDRFLTEPKWEKKEPSMEKHCFLGIFCAQNTTQRELLVKTFMYGD